MSIKNSKVSSHNGDGVVSISDNRSVEDRLNDVIDFIETYGHIYGYRLQEVLNSKKSSGVTKEEIVANRYSMYERLSKL